MSGTTYFSQEERPSQELQQYLMADTKGQTLAEHFTISSEALEGGMGQVFFCQDKRDKIFYALKTVPAGDSKYEEILKQEALFSLSLEKHPHLVYTRTVTQENGRYCIVMEFIGPQPKSIEENVQGSTLARLMSQRRLSQAECLRWAIEFCRGMEYLNRQGMKAHKDIKPSNLFITPQGHLKIGDFGLAGLDKKGGTLGYRPPELSTPGTPLTPQSDIYSFGLVLYQMLNGGASLTDQTATGSNSTYDTLPQAALQASPCSAILQKCLHKDPAQRYADFTALKKALELAYLPNRLEELPIPAMQAEDCFYKGLGLQALKDNEKALCNYNKALEINPNYAAAYNNRANLKRELEDYESALQDYNKALEIDPTSALIYNNRGLLKKDLKDTVGAMQDFDKALGVNPHSADTYSNRANLKRELENYEGAMQDFDKALEINPNNADTYNNRGNLKRQLTDYEGALQDYNKALEIAPNNAVIYNNRAALQCDRANYNSALQDYNKALGINPNFTDAYINSGLLKNDLGDTAGAMKDYNKALELNPDNADAYNNRANLKRNLGDKNGALQDYNKALKISPNDADIYNGRGVLKNDLGDATGALQDYNKALELNPNDANAYNNRGLLKKDLKDTVGAMKDYNKALEINPYQPIAYDNRASLKEILGDLNGALQDYNKALELNPNYAAAYNSRAELNILLKSYAQAVQDAATAVKLNPAHKAYYLTLIKAYQKANQPQKAQETENKMHELGL